MIWWWICSFVQSLDRSFVQPSSPPYHPCNNCRSPRLFCHVKIDRWMEMENVQIESIHFWGFFSFQQQHTIITFTFKILNRKWKFSLMNQMIQQKNWVTKVFCINSFISQDILLLHLFHCFVECFSQFVCLSFTQWMLWIGRCSWKFM